MSEPTTRSQVHRRTLLKAVAAGTAVAGFPLPLRAQPPALKIGAIHPVTGPLAEIGQACRLGAQLAAEAVNAAGGITAMGGARLEILAGDSQSQADVARSEAERLLNAGAVILTGAFHSQHTAAIVPLAQQRRVRF
jgi:branched-chain amino acid transport system substrate-binding protein